MTKSRLELKCSIAIIAHNLYCCGKLKLQILRVLHNNVYHSNIASLQKVGWLAEKAVREVLVHSI